MNFVASSPSLELSGANVLLARLLGRAVAAGHEAQWLITSHAGEARTDWLKDAGIAFRSLPPTPMNAVAERQRQLLETAGGVAPCVYFPNFDFDMLWAASALPASCRTAFIMHCDDPVYYEAIENNGTSMDAIICVSAFLADSVSRRWPALADRVHHIPFGVDVPEAAGEPQASEYLEVAYCGRLSHEQKRVGDLAEIICACYQRGLKIRFHIAGTGPDEAEFFARIAEPLAAGAAVRLGLLPNHEVHALLQRSQVFILTSAYEGLPVSLLEAMAAGCVPLVTAVASGVSEVVNDGVEGFLKPVGDWQAMVDSLTLLAAEPGIVSRCGAASRARITDGGYTLDRSVARYLELSAAMLAAPRRAPLAKSPQVPPHYRTSHRLKRKVLGLLGLS